ncbi:hypothetical protein M1567_01265 [Candidatus Marsarchaeota archaeon]|jgi:hypothetical protein|nr:hypothetical protein [Candidatus Marsarchaeota archaeon]
MLWLLISVLLSFDIIEALVPVIIILILIAAAAGLTRGTDIFALFGLGTIMGFANAGSGRVGKGLKGTRYGADAIKRGRAAGKARGGLVKNAKKARAKYAAAKAKAPAAKNRVRIKRAKLINKRIQNLQKRGRGNSPKALKLQRKLTKLKAATMASYNAKKVATSVITNPLGKNGKLAVPTLAGGMAISAASISRLHGKKISGRASKFNFQLNNQQKKEAGLQQQHMKSGVYKQHGIASFKDIPTATRYASISKGGVRIGHVPKFNNYVKTVNSKTGTHTNVLKIPKSAFVQSGATSAIAMSLLQRHWSKQIEKGGPHAERAERRLGKLNDVVAKMHYGASSAKSAFESANKGELRSKNAGRLNDLVSFGLPVPGGRLIGHAIGRRYHEEKLQRLPHEDYWSTYRDRRRDYDKIRREMDASKDHTVLHPIAGKHGSESIKAKRKKLWNKAYEKALKGMK